VLELNGSAIGIELCADHTDPRRCLSQWYCWLHLQFCPCHIRWICLGWHWQQCSVDALLTASVYRTLTTVCSCILTHAVIDNSWVATSAAFGLFKWFPTARNFSMHECVINVQKIKGVIRTMVHRPPATLSSLGIHFCVKHLRIKW